MTGVVVAGGVVVGGEVTGVVVAGIVVEATAAGAAAGDVDAADFESGDAACWCATEVVAELGASLAELVRAAANSLGVQIVAKTRTMATTTSDSRRSRRWTGGRGSLRRSGPT